MIILIWYDKMIKFLHLKISPHQAKKQKSYHRKAPRGHVLVDLFKHSRHVCERPKHPKVKHSSSNPIIKRGTVRETGTGKTSDHSSIDMDSDNSPAFAYAVYYVEDVARSIAFYRKAFGYHVRRLDKSHRCMFLFRSFPFSRILFWVGPIDRGVLSCMHMYTHGCRWGELESGQTTIAFTPIHQYETDGRTGTVKTPELSRERQQMEVCFAYQDVDAAYKV